MRARAAPVEVRERSSSARGRGASIESAAPSRCLLRVSDRRKVLPQYVLPKRGLTAFAGRVASRERGATTTRLVRWFVRKYGVDMSEAAVADVAAYASFNDFFTRALKEGARPIADADLICPVDGTISQFGRIEHDQILQAKGHRYSTTALVGGDARAGRALPRRQLRDALPEPEGLPPHPHAVRRHADADDPRAGRPVLGQPDDGARRAGPVRAQRARRLRVRFAGRRHLRAHARRRDHRRQHGDGLARRGQTAARAPRARMALRRAAQSR